MLQQQGGGIQPGVYAAGDYMVTQRGAGANMSVDIAAGGAWVQGTAARQGLYHQVNDATVNQTVTAADATNPRVDQVILAINDSSVSGVSDTPTLTVVAGTATAGATLANRTGANNLSAFPNFIRLADVLVGAAAPSIGNTVIRDRRPWARGAFVVIPRSSANYTTTGTTMAAIDGTNLSPRIECSGTPLRVKLEGSAFNSGANAYTAFQLFVDGVATGPIFYQYSGAVNENQTGALLDWTFTPSAGSHVLQLQWKVPSGTGTLEAAAQPCAMTVEELVRQNSANNTTTSG